MFKPTFPGSPWVHICHRTPELPPSLVYPRLWSSWMSCPVVDRRCGELEFFQVTGSSPGCDKCKLSYASMGHLRAQSQWLRVTTSFLISFSLSIFFFFLLCPTRTNQSNGLEIVQLPLFSMHNRRLCRDMNPASKRPPFGSGRMAWRSVGALRIRLLMSY